MSNTKLYVGNLPWSTTEESLNQLFSAYGEVTDCVIITDRATGRSKGFGFVTFSDANASSSAAAALDGKAFDGGDASSTPRELRVNAAQDNRSRNR